ncbi:FAD binding domain-containing protein [Pisolithus croceorrhizus]|nr:FAD binding domain-containing protein [Pisolithus croceorrhizus]
MPKVSKPAPRPRIRRKASNRADSSLVERMAQRNARYLQLFNDHADLVRGKKADEVTNAYHRVMSRGIMSDSTTVTDGDLDAVECLLHTPTATLDDHVFVGLTAHSLLLSQMEAMKKLPYDVMAQVGARTIELGSLSRDRNSNLQQEKCALLTPPSTLPELERLPISRRVPLTDATVRNMLASPSTLVGKRFVLRDVDVYYCIASVTISLTGCTFSLQYEDVSIRYKEALRYLDFPPISVLMTVHSAKSEVDVLIVGAGPAGVMCANALSLASVNVRIADKRDTKVAAGQADGIALAQLRFSRYIGCGLADRLLREGCRVYMAAFYNPNESGGIELSNCAPDILAPSGRYLLELALHQGAIESIFLDSMKTRGVVVQRSTRPIAIESSNDAVELADPTSHPVKVTLERRSPDGTAHHEVVHAKFDLGADGAHSWVRNAFGITMDGEQTDSIWGVLDMVPDTGFPDIRNKSLIHSNDGSCLLVPREAERIRIYMQIADTDVCDPNWKTQKSLYPYSLNPTNGINWWTLYTTGQRVASKFSVHNRVFIAGDACHTHSPKAGQGMNASMNDSHNLAWKLAYVLRGWAPISILSTYESERRKYALDLVAFDKIYAALFSGKRLTKENMNGVSHERFLKRTFGGFTSGIGVHYDRSVLVSENMHPTLVRNMVVGERVAPQNFVCAADSTPYNPQDLLPSDFPFKLLVFTGDFNAPIQTQKVEGLVKSLERPDSFLNRYPRERFDIITVSKGNKLEFDYHEIPQLLRPHWSKVFLDDTDVSGTIGGEGYAYYGIPDEGAFVVVRPDGYITMIAPLDGADEINKYLAGFMDA